MSFLFIHWKDNCRTRVKLPNNFLDSRLSCFCDICSLFGYISALVDSVVVRKQSLEAQVSDVFKRSGL